MGANQQRPQRQGLLYALLALVVTILALAGYAGYVLYPRFDLPAASGIGLLVLAAAAGIASFFSPCSFPLLVSLLAHETGAGTSQQPSSVRPALRYGGALAVGAALFLIITGIVIAFGGSALFSGVTFTSAAGISIRAIIGSLLIVLGLIQLDVTPLSFRKADALALPIMRRQARFRREHPVLGFGFLGFIYLLAGFG